MGKQQIPEGGERWFKIGNVFCFMFDLSLRFVNPHFYLCPLERIQMDQCLAYFHWSSTCITLLEIWQDGHIKMLRGYLEFFMNPSVSLDKHSHVGGLAFQLL